MKTTRFICVILLGFFIASCSSGSSETQTGAKVTGTVASGKAIAGANVTLKDSNGRNSTATTAADGTFTLNADGFTPPFMLQATSTGNVGTLYSVSADSKVDTTINITPLTDIIIRSWYNVQGISTDTAFSALASNPAPSPAAVQILSSTIQNMVQLWLGKAGVPIGFNLISTPFLANSSGIDSVLDQIQTYAPPSTAGTTVFSISDGTTTETANISYSTSANNTSMVIVTSTEGISGISNNNITSLIPVTLLQQAILDGINKTLNNLASTIISKGYFLTYSDLLPYLDSNLIQDGLNQSQLAINLVSIALATKLSGQAPLFYIKSINSLDTANNVAEVNINGIGSMFFKKNNSDSIWLIYGNRRVANLFVTANMDHRQGIPCLTPCDGMKVSAKVDAPENTVSNVSITGGDIWNNTNAPLTEIVGGLNYNLDRFWLDSPPLIAFPEVGTPFQVQITTTNGVASYTVLSNTYTSELISITNLTGSTIDVANLGSPLTVNWTIPTTFPIQQMGLSYGAYTGPRNVASYVCTGNGYMNDPVIASATVTIPTTCNGSPVVSVNLGVFVLGVNGETTKVTYVIN